MVDNSNFIIFLIFAPILLLFIWGLVGSAIEYRKRGLIETNGLKGVAEKWKKKK